MVQLFPLDLCFQMCTSESKASRPGSGDRGWPLLCLFAWGTRWPFSSPPPLRCRFLLGCEQKNKTKQTFKHKLLHGTSRTWRFLFGCEHEHIQTQAVQHIYTCIKLTHARLTEQAHTALDATDVTQANSDTTPPFASGSELSVGNARAVGLAHLFSVNIRRRWNCLDKLPLCLFWPSRAWRLIIDLLTKLGPCQSDSLSPELATTA